MEQVVTIPLSIVAIGVVGIIAYFVKDRVKKYDAHLLQCGERAVAQARLEGEVKGAQTRLEGELVGVKSGIHALKEHVDTRIDGVVEKVDVIGENVTTLTRHVLEERRR